MRTYDEMMSLIMDKAKNDERIRAVVMDGSRSNPDSTHDKYSDFDICYIVSDIREFTNDKKWIEYFGKILIVQYSCDWYNHPYDYSSKERFAYLIQFEDGNRIDLTLIDVSDLENEKNNNEPRTVLLNKDNFKELIPISDTSVFNIKKPTEKEYYDTCNEFRWLSIYITKGLCRDEFYYAKGTYDSLVMPMFMKMINWKVAIDHNFEITTGVHSKYLKRFLNEDEMKRFEGIFPNGTYVDIWEKLYVMYDYFAENAEYVADKLGYFFDREETKNVRNFLKLRQEDMKN